MNLDRLAGVIIGHDAAAMDLQRRADEAELPEVSCALLNAAQGQRDIAKMKRQLLEQHHGLEGEELKQAMLAERERVRERTLVGEGL